MNDYNIYNSKVGKFDTKSVNKDYGKQENNQMEKAIEQLKYLTEVGGVPEYGDYNAIKVNFKNDNMLLNADDIELSIAPSILLKERPKERELQIKVYSTDRSLSYSVTLFRGEKAEILKELDNDELKDKIKKFISEASDKFNEE